MYWTYRVFRSPEEKYSLREVFYEQDGSLIRYSKEPVQAIDGSLEGLLQVILWFKEAFDLPVLTIEEMDAILAAQPERKTPDGRGISLEELRAELELEATEAAETSEKDGNERAIDGSTGHH